MFAISGGLRHITAVPERRTSLLPTDAATLGYLLAISILIVVFNPQLPGWYPFFLVIFRSREAENLVHLAFPGWKSVWLLVADFKLLGGYLAVSLEKIVNSYVAEFSEFIHFSHCFIPFFCL